jgi:hypothetical protein
MIRFYPFGLRPVPTDKQKTKWKSSGTAMLLSVRLHCALKSGKNIQLKGIVSRDFVVCFWCHSIDLKLLPLTERILLLLKFRVRAHFFWFSRIGIVSLLCELSWTVCSTFRSFCCSSVLGSHYGAHANAVLAGTFWRWKLSQSGDSAAPCLEFFLLSRALINFLCTTNRILPLSPRLGLNHRSSHRVDSLQWDVKIEKFDTKWKPMAP